jgi:beta-galactosidase
MDPILHPHSTSMDKQGEGRAWGIPRLATGLILLAAALSGANITERREAMFLQSRVKLRIDENWKLYNITANGNAPSNPQATSYNDASWSTVNVPNDMSFYEMGSSSNLSSAGGEDPGAQGWYRKHFTIPASWVGKKVIVQFDGVYHDSKIYLNGTQIGAQEYGYVSFTCDLTKYLNPTGDNVLAVYVDNITVRTSRWYSGTGIFRHVWLIATDPVYVNDWGTAVTTPMANSSSAQINVKTEVMNTTTSSQSRTVKTIICDSTGKQLQSVSTAVTIAAGATDTVAQTITLASPSLWSPGNPYVYNSYTQILNGTAVADDYVTPFGIRTLQFVANQGMLINGVVTKMEGGCIHHTVPPVGAAVPDAVLERVIRGLKASGETSIRTSHAPMSPEFYDLCDKLGMLVLDEWCDKWDAVESGNWYQDWATNWRNDLHLFLIRDRNHPSVVIWSVGNETDGGGSNGKISQWTFNTLDTIVPYAKKIESSRPYTHACVAGWGSDWQGYANLAQHEDIIGVNYQDWQYSNIHNLAGNALILGTEQYPYLSGNSPEWPGEKNNGYVIGENIWTSMDYMGEGRPLGSASGFVDNCVFRKTWFWYMKSQWQSDTNFVKIGVGDPTFGSGNAWASPTLAEHWNGFSGNQTVVAYTTGDQVNLYLNGNQVGGSQYTKNTTNGNNILTFTVPYSSGTLKAIAYRSGLQIATDSLVTTGSPSQLLIRPDRTTIYADGNDVSNIEVYVADAQGRPVRNATNTISYTLSGNGRGFGIGSGDWSNTQAFTQTSRKAYEGRVYIPIQSDTIPGTITVNITSSGLSSTPLTLTTVLEPWKSATTGIREEAASKTVVASSRLLSCAVQTGLLRIQYQLDANSPVDLSVVTPSGRVLSHATEPSQAAGMHNTSLNGFSQSGIYLVSLKANGHESVNKVVVP